MTESLEPVQPANRVISRKALSIVKYLVLLVTGMCVVGLKSLIRCCVELKIYFSYVGYGGDPGCS